MKIDNGTGGNRETSTGKPERVGERGREPINFFSELKRRNVYKVAIAYVVAGWALSQGIAQVFPVFDVPNWIIRLIVLLIIIGLPIALVLAWSLEITPQGIKRTETADAMPATARKKKHVDLRGCYRRDPLDRSLLPWSLHCSGYRQSDSDFE